MTFATATAKGYTERDFDLICFFDCLHDMGDPVGAARHARQALKADGTVLLVEPFASDSLDQNSNPVGRMFYAASTIHLHAELALPGGRPRPGRAGGRGPAARGVRGGRLQRFRRATETPFNLILEARK